MTFYLKTYLYSTDTFLFCPNCLFILTFAFEMIDDLMKNAFHGFLLLNSLVC